jgi:hypothetical protein
MTLYCDCVLRLPCDPGIKRRWIESLQVGEQGAVAALLLSQLPNLRHLDTFGAWCQWVPVFGLGGQVRHYPPIDPTTSYHRWLLDSVNDCTAFSSLQSVYLQSLPYPINRVANLLAIPSLRSLHLGTIADDATPLDLRPKCSNVERLSFDSLMVSFRCLADILMACRELRHFRYVSPLDDRVTGELSALLGVLESFSGSLEAIQIMCLPSATVDKSTPRSLSAFKKLRDLACDASVLTHPSRISRLSALLPPSIQKVHVHNIYTDFVQQFGDHASIRKDMSQSDDGTRLFTNLCEVKLVKGIILQRHVLQSEECIEDGVKFTVESFGRA